MRQRQRTKGPEKLNIAQCHVTVQVVQMILQPRVFKFQDLSENYIKETHYSDLHPVVCAEKASQKPKQKPLKIYFPQQPEYSAWLMGEAVLLPQGD